MNELITVQSCTLQSTTSTCFGWCDSSHSTTVPMRSPPTSYWCRGERV